MGISKVMLIINSRKRDGYMRPLKSEGNYPFMPRSTGRRYYVGICNKTLTLLNAK